MGGKSPNKPTISTKRLEWGTIINHKTRKELHKILTNKVDLIDTHNKDFVQNLF